jgi:hypothetical protein
MAQRSNRETILGPAVKSRNGTWPSGHCDLGTFVRLVIRWAKFIISSSSALWKIFGDPSADQPLWSLLKFCDRTTSALTARLLSFSTIIEGISGADMVAWRVCVASHWYTGSATAPSSCSRNRPSAAPTRPHSVSPIKHKSAVACIQYRHISSASCLAL